MVVWKKNVGGQLIERRAPGFATSGFPLNSVFLKMPHGNKIYLMDRFLSSMAGLVCLKDMWSHNIENNLMKHRFFLVKLPKRWVSVGFPRFYHTIQMLPQCMMPYRTTVQLWAFAVCPSPSKQMGAFQVFRSTSQCPNPCQEWGSCSTTRSDEICFGRTKLAPKPNWRPVFSPRKSYSANLGQPFPVRERLARSPLFLAILPGCQPHFLPVERKVCSGFVLLLSKKMEDSMSPFFRLQNNNNLSFLERLSRKANWMDF